MKNDKSCINECDRNDHQKKQFHPKPNQMNANSAMGIIWETAASRENTNQYPVNKLTDFRENTLNVAQTDLPVKRGVKRSLIILKEYKSLLFCGSCCLFQ